MKILRQGKIKTYEKKFNCKNCDTIFKCEKGEYKVDICPRDRDTIYSVNCPTCKEYCQIIEYKK